MVCVLFLVLVMPFLVITAAALHLPFHNQVYFSYFNNLL